ncbi:SH3 domain-containing protein [Roseibium polysiphoniae]|uniref:SH3 domain-containing protein n=1 Tax=Roseibium polysiphoniae TaxID=2571221 RepID=UPI00329A3DBE
MDVVIMFDFHRLQITIIWMLISTALASFCLVGFGNAQTSMGISASEGVSEQNEMSIFLDDLDSSLDKADEHEDEKQPASEVRSGIGTSISADNHEEVGSLDSAPNTSSGATSSFDESSSSSAMSSSGMSDMSSSSKAPRAASVTGIEPEGRVLAINDPSDGWLNIRNGPGTSHEIIKRLDNGTLVRELRRSGKWVEVLDPTGRTGWGYLPYMRLVRQ